MGGLRNVDRPCKKCGAMMNQVPSTQMYCNNCRKRAPKHSDTVSESKKKMTLQDIMREADKEGLQYASYCKKHGLY